MPGPASSPLPTRVCQVGTRRQRAMSPGKRRSKARVCGEEKRGLRGRVHGEEGGAANPTTDYPSSDKYLSSLMMHPRNAACNERGGLALSMRRSAKRSERKSGGEWLRGLIIAVVVLVVLAVV